MLFWYLFRFWEIHLTSICVKRCLSCLMVLIKQPKNWNKALASNVLSNIFWIIQHSCLGYHLIQSRDLLKYITLSWLKKNTNKNSVQNMKESDSPVEMWNTTTRLWQRYIRNSQWLAYVWRVTKAGCYLARLWARRVGPHQLLYREQRIKTWFSTVVKRAEENTGT